MAFFSRYLSVGLILTLGLSMTGMATLWVGRWEREVRRNEFQRQINNLTTALQRTTYRYTELLLSISDLYQATDHAVDATMFSQFGQRALGVYPGIQALEWAPVIQHADRATYEQQLAAIATTAPVTITERDHQGNLKVASQRSVYVPVTFVVPWAGNELALGYDLASDPTRREALERARDTGAIAASGRLQLVQDRVNPQYGFLVFVPIYALDSGASATRSTAITGYILGVFRVRDVVEEALQDLDSDLDFYIVDQTARSPDQLLGFYDAQRQEMITQTTLAIPLRRSSNLLCPTPDDCIQSLTLGQRDWQLVFLPSTTPAPLWSTLSTLLIGLLMTVILLVYLSRWQLEIYRTRELSQLKLRLFSMTSHELRTPLSVITISAQSLEANAADLTPQQQANAIARIRLAAKRMGQLVNDMLTLTRAEAGKLEFHPEIVELLPFCQQLCDQIELKSDQMINLRCPTSNLKAFLDKKLLHSILVNLLSNAAKYSPAGSTIQLAIALEGEDLRLQVRDPGIGIPNSAIAHIFDTFYRGDNVGSEPGTGLGLAVVKSCVERHGGHLTVQSEPGQGTQISVTIPRVA